MLYIPHCEGSLWGQISLIQTTVMTHCVHTIRLQLWTPRWEMHCAQSEKTHSGECSICSTTFVPFEHTSMEDSLQCFLLTLVGEHCGEGLIQLKSRVTLLVVLV